MSTKNGLQVLTDVTRRLAAIKTVGEAKELRDQAEAIRRYAKESRKGLKAQNEAARIKFLCERRAGELLLSVPKQQGKRDRHSDGLVLTIKKSGISSQTGYRWMDLARMPEAELRKVLHACDTNGEELTSDLVYGLVVRDWKASHRRPGDGQWTWNPDADAPPPEFERQLDELIEWEVLHPDDLVKLSDLQRAVVVRETWAAVEDLCEDAHAGRVWGKDGWAPAWTPDRQTIRYLARQALAELLEGKIATRQFRGKIRPHEGWSRRGSTRHGKPTGPPKRPQPYRIVPPFEAYLDLAKRFAQETRGLLKPHKVGLLDRVEQLALSTAGKAELRAVLQKVGEAVEGLQEEIGA